MNTAATNEAPRIEWFRFDLVHAVRRRLYVAGRETPYFIDSTERTAHMHAGKKHSLHVSGMHQRGCAALLQSHSRADVLMHQAEQLAFRTA